jgi:hypothetical protein
MRGESCMFDAKSREFIELKSLRRKGDTRPMGMAFSVAETHAVVRAIRTWTFVAAEMIKPPSRKTAAEVTRFCQIRHLGFVIP